MIVGLLTWHNGKHFYLCHILMSHIVIILYFRLPYFMSQIVLYFVHGTPVLPSYIDVVSTNPILIKLGTRFIKLSEVSVHATYCTLAHHCCSNLYIAPINCVIWRSECTSSHFNMPSYIYDALCVCVCLCAGNTIHTIHFDLVFTF